MTLFIALLGAFIVVMTLITSDVVWLRILSAAWLVAYTMLAAFLIGRSVAKEDHK